MSSHNTIAVRWMTPIKDTKKITTASLPGEAVTPAGDRSTVIRSAAAGRNGGVRVLLEDSLQGKKKTEAYAVNAQAQVGTFRSGDILQVLVEAAENIVIGDVLTNNGTNGTWKESNGVADHDIAIALESSGGALGADTLLLVEVI